MSHSIHEYVNDMLEGRRVASHFRKVPGLASTSYCWADIGMAAGCPPPNYYASNPLVSAILGKFDGIFHGDDKAPDGMYLSELMLVTPTANMIGLYTLLDYLLYYPFIDLDDGSATQVMTQAAAIPRYTDGNGVMAILIAQAPTTGNGQFKFTYINQNGIEQTSPVQFCTTSGINMGTLVTSQPASAAGLGPYLKLAEGDTGIRAVTGFTNLISNGGLGALVLVKPLADIVISEINTPSELTLINRRPGRPRIYDGAFLNFIANTSGSIAAGLLTGSAMFVWTEND